MNAGPSQDARMAWTRRSLLGHAAAGAALAPMAWSSAHAQTDPQIVLPRQNVLPNVVVTSPDTLGVLDIKSDPYGRMTTQVMLNGQGPFRFFVDTGANRSALSASTAARVGAVVSGQAIVHGVNGSEIMPTATLGSLRCGVFEQTDTVVPILGDDLILPAAGMLGMDRFSGLRLEFDNSTREMTVKRSVRTWPEALSVPATIKFGQLVSAKGRIGGVTAPIIFDTGGEYSLANNALREAIRARARKIPQTKVATATMPMFIEDTMIIPQIRLQTVLVRNTMAFVGDFHVFELWDLIKEPALIVGMQVLRTAQRFAIDYKRKEVQFIT